jgi:transposase
MIVLLKEINKAAHEAGGRLEMEESDRYRKRYRELLQDAEQEC